MNVVALSLTWLNAAIWFLVTWFYFIRARKTKLRLTISLDRIFVFVAAVLFLDRLNTAFFFSGHFGALPPIPHFYSSQVVQDLINVLMLTIGAIILCRGSRQIDDLDQMLVKSGLYKRYRYMIESDMRAILLFQMNRHLMEINRQGCRWLKGTEEELCGLSLQEVIARLQSEEDPQVLIERLKRKEPVELRVDDRILSYFDWSELVDEKGQTVGWVLCFCDVTEEKKFQREIIQSEKLAVVGQLAAATAHEIRNPLTSIKGFLQLLDQRLTGSQHEGETKEYTRIMVEEIDRMEKIIRDFLLMTKPSDITRETADLVAVIERILVLVQNQATLRNIHVVTDLVPLPHVRMHKEAIQQVVLNLLQNAFEAMNVGGTLTIQTEEDVSHVAVKITDTGIGMTEEQIANLGSPFYSTKTEGTGLGLTVSSKIIREHGGRLDVESQIGVGTTITVRLPK